MRAMASACAPFAIKHAELFSEQVPQAAWHSAASRNGTQGWSRCKVGAEGLWGPEDSVAGASDA